MVFLSILSFFKYNPQRIYNPGPTKFWTRRKFLRMSAHYRGRKRNCYVLARRNVERAMVYAVKGRKIKIHDMLMLYGQRMSAASEEIGLDSVVMKQGLEAANVLLDNHSLADLSIWEPRTFKALGNFAWHNYSSHGFGNIKDLGKLPDGVILRGLKK